MFTRESQNAIEAINSQVDRSIPPDQLTSRKIDLGKMTKVRYTPGPEKSGGIKSVQVCRTPSQSPVELTDAVQDIITLWQERTGNTLTNDEANESVANIVGFFRVLIEWDQDQREDA